MIGAANSGVPMMIFYCSLSRNGCFHPFNRRKRETAKGTSATAMSIAEAGSGTGVARKAYMLPCESW